MENVMRRIGLAEDTLEKLGKILKHHNMSMATKKRILECYVTFALLYGCECWTISAVLQKK